MINKIFSLATVVLTLVLAGNVFAAVQNKIGGENNQVQAADVNNAVQFQAQTGEGENVNQTQNQAQIQNQGEEQAVQAMEMEMSGAGTDDSLAEQRRSRVANAVQAMLQLAEENNNIGEKIREVAKNQNQNQINIEASLEKIQSRNRLVKILFGPDYKEVANCEKILMENREEVKELNEIKNQLINQAEQQELAEQIQVLEQAHLEIENSLEQAQTGFSLFGWLAKLFV